MTKREITEFNEQYGKRLRNDEFSLDDFLQDFFKKECGEFDRENRNRIISPKSDVTPISPVTIVCSYNIN